MVEYNCLRIRQKIITESFDQKKRNYRTKFLLLTDGSIKNQNDDPIAFLQIIKYYFLGINFFFINRGPIFNTNISSEIKKKICQEIIFYLLPKNQSQHHILIL